MTQIIDAMRSMNPWWIGSFSVQYHNRDIYENLGKFLNMPQIIAFTGLRRVGKTTIMYKIIEDFIKKAIDPKNIFYFSFDRFRETDIIKMVKEYEAAVEKDIEKGKFVFLFDEIQKLNDWENQLKFLYDIYKNRIKIIISGSESLFVKKRSKETLAGRIFEFKINTLTFSEFLDFKDLELKPYSIHRKELKSQFNEFMLTMGFPELVGIKDREIIEKYIKEGIVEKIVYRDIPKSFNIRDVSILESILNIFMNDPGQIIELSELSKELKITRQTLSIYLTYLEESYLIRKLYNFSKNKRKTERKLKKYYPSLLSTNILFKDDAHSKSKVFEWLIVNQLNAEFFWRDQYKNEVDIVIDFTPIEIKYGKIEIGGLTAFMKAFRIKEGYVISFDIEDERKIDNYKISIIPAFKFLLEPKNIVSVSS